jgi:hypothetical protein
MRRQFLYSLLVVVLVACFSYAQQSESKKTSPDSAAVGTWSGSWQGGSNGKFEMTISKAPDGKLTGTLTAHPTEGDGYTAPFKSVDVTGGKLTVKLADADDQVEITITGALDPAAMKGSYSVRSKPQGEEVDGGTWEAKKK